MLAHWVQKMLIGWSVSTLALGRKDIAYLS